ncbi:GOLPH3/VPS74 family protein [Streptomyces justiciae]|uniref:GOLPH3/VPS74 family protein n=1 Tax=Streptomyces justiciae TaxID=2780140 RepID=UPI00188296D4|nr:GPP34 family phosphoprotein [Streptomyces justiciae]MBE8478024.1 GPP34 family phosphoprotein [Streptomyces justiciae]MCW8383707.1 GPP34 family phosphoprotein [Streptomyces justiciae]
MSTARDLVLVALGKPAGHLVGQGDLSLTLAGAEAVDLLRSGALKLDGDRIVPGPPTVTGDVLLDQADASLARQEPYETLDDWLWRRADGLAMAYVHELERTGLLVHEHRHGFRLLSERTVLADSRARRAAEERRASGEPVLTALLAAAGIDEEPLASDGSALDDAVTSVLAAVGDAVVQLESLRLRRDVENAAFDNVWRG